MKVLFFFFCLLIFQTSWAEDDPPMYYDLISDDCSMVESLESEGKKLSISCKPLYGISPVQSCEGIGIDAETKVIYCGH
ncbi:MAG: hypothetical protein MJK18_05125, partial [Bdellovibrionales bacterium]|nr:hypothetical protein [Bdellovibrionales bacterium]